MGVNLRAIGWRRWARLPPTECELLVSLVSRLLEAAEPYAPGDADDFASVRRHNRAAL